MSKSTKKHQPAASVEKAAPSNWTATRPHKYCGKMDAASPKKTKANKTQDCDACAEIKARVERLNTKEKSNRREEKMSWAAGDGDWD